jgi:class III poly(R)-hydroxyalkanoic acid synthase PhaE subunit
MDTQRRYWEQWTEMQQQALGIKKPPSSPWEQAMEHWRGAVQGAVPSIGQDFFGKMMDQGKAFFQMAEQTMQAASGRENVADAWARLLAGLTESFRQTPDSDAFKQATAFWEMPLDNWNRMASAISPIPGDLLRSMPHGGVREQFDRMLGAPGLGYTRESQTQYQNLMQAVMEYQEALAQYSLFFSRMGEKSVNLLQKRCSDAPIESARHLYDSWVGCCEDVYAAEVMTDDYRRLHGRMVNALMKLKSRWGAIFNELLSAMNIPTRDDLRTLQERMQEQRRENKSLRAEVNVLRREFRKIQADAAKPAVKQTVKKTATRKTTAPGTKKVAAKKP